MTSLSRTQRALLYLAAWLPFYVLYAIMLTRSHTASSYAAGAYFAATYTAPGILVGALIWRWAKSLRWREIRWPARVALETGIAFGFIALWQALFIGFLALVAGIPTVQANLQQLLEWPLLMLLLVAAVHSAAFHVTRVLGELHERELAVAKSEALRVRAEMAALRGQLDPHFLFNSLHSITALVREDATRAEDALLQFAGLLRRVLELKRENGDEVTLDDEMRFVDDYLAIERLRLGDRLRLERFVTPEALACWVPAFSVQPLVENALHHAIAPRRDGGTVAIRAGVNQGTLTIEVEDNGPGAAAADLAGADGVGLSAIRQRLALRYGKGGTLSIATEPGKGFRVTIAVPALTEPLLPTREGFVA